MIHLYSKTVVVYANLLLKIDAAQNWRCIPSFIFVIYQNYKSLCTFISLAFRSWNVHSGMDINRFYRIHVTCETSIDISHVTSIRIPFPRFASVVRFIASKFVGMGWKVKSLRSRRKESQIRNVMLQLTHSSGNPYLMTSRAITWSHIRRKNCYSRRIGEQIERPKFSISVWLLSIRNKYVCTYSP